MPRAMDTRSRLRQAVAFALTRCRRQLAAMIKSHDTDDARREAAEIIVAEIERANFEIRERPPGVSAKTP